MENLTEFFKQKYLEAKEVVEKLDNGTWKNDPKITNMSVKEIEAVREVKKQLEDMGYALTTKVKN